MPNLLDTPWLLFLVALIAGSLAVHVGMALAQRGSPMSDAQRADFNLILGATLTLLSLIIGFSFSMATNRYDARLNLEEAEANAIGTAYVRVDLLGSPHATDIKTLLRQYTDLRCTYYLTKDRATRKDLAIQTAQLQDQLWERTLTGAQGQPTPLTALATAAMNDVLNSQGYTQASWRNRIPPGAWSFIGVVGLLACSMVGYSVHSSRKQTLVMLLLPLILAISLFLIADIDSPRGGIIQVPPRNLQALAQSMQTTAPGHQAVAR